MIIHVGVVKKNSFEEKAKKAIGGAVQVIQDAIKPIKILKENPSIQPIRRKPMHSNTQSSNEIISEILEDLMVPGFSAEVSPLDAEIMGAFFEDALNEEDAMEAIYD